MTTFYIDSDQGIKFLQEMVTALENVVKTQADLLTAYRSGVFTDFGAMSNAAVNAKQKLEKLYHELEQRNRA